MEACHRAAACQAERLWAACRQAASHAVAPHRVAYRRAACRPVACQAGLRAGLVLRQEVAHPSEERWVGLLWMARRQSRWDAQLEIQALPQAVLDGQMVGLDGQMVGPDGQVVACPPFAAEHQMAAYPLVAVLLAVVHPCVEHPPWVREEVLAEHRAAACQEAGHAEDAASARCRRQQGDLREIRTRPSCVQS